MCLCAFCFCVHVRFSAEFLTAKASRRTGRNSQEYSTHIIIITHYTILCICMVNMLGR
jgi:hypothetical protein